jgi:hypothetical protein
MVENIQNIVVKTTFYTAKGVFGVLNYGGRIQANRAIKCYDNVENWI